MNIDVCTARNGAELRRTDQEQQAAQQPRARAGVDQLKAREQQPPTATAPAVAILRGPSRGYSRPIDCDATATPIASMNVVVPEPIGV